MALESTGFILTVANSEGSALASPYATTMPEVFAIGDVRSRSIKRVAAAVEEGSVVVHAVHQFLNPAVI